MTEVEKIKKYIERTKIDGKTRLKYEISISQWEALVNSSPSIFDVASLAFDYGMTKGYRAGIREAKR